MGHKLRRDVAILGKRYSLADATQAGIFDACVPAPSLVDRAISTAGMVAAKAKQRDAMHKIKGQVHKSLVEALHRPVDPNILQAKL